MIRELAKIHRLCSNFSRETFIVQQNSRAAECNTNEHKGGAFNKPARRAPAGFKCGCPRDDLGQKR